MNGDERRWLADAGFVPGRDDMGGAWDALADVDLSRLDALVAQIGAVVGGDDPWGDDVIAIVALTDAQRRRLQD